MADFAFDSYCNCYLAAAVGSYTDNDAAKDDVDGFNVEVSVEEVGCTGRCGAGCGDDVMGSGEVKKGGGGSGGGMKDGMGGKKGIIGLNAICGFNNKGFAICCCCCCCCCCKRCSNISVEFICGFASH